MIIVLFLISGCDKELAEIDEHKVMKKLSLQEEELINATNSLSIDILKAEFQHNQDENFFFSPVSVGMALGMIHNGVSEREKTQIQFIMGLESLEKKEINKSYSQFLNFLQVSNDQFDISYANSLWFSDNIDINEDFRTRVMAYYDAEISELNFNKSSSFNFINSWGSLKTRGNFEKLIEGIPSKNSDIFLINAFGLNTSWREGNNFKTTNDFYTAKGEKLKSSTMNFGSINIKKNENGDYNFLEIPFETANFYLSIVQPQELSFVSELIESFTIEELKYLTENAYMLKANVSLPEINFTGNGPLKTTLSNIGLQNIFSSRSDFSSSFIDSDKHVSDISYRAKININTHSFSNSIDTTFSNENLELLSVDKPFLYFVRENHTKTVLFAGYFSNPSN